MNLSLDEIISTGREKFSFRGRGRGRGRGIAGRGTTRNSGGVRGGRVQKFNIISPRSLKNTEVWQHDLFQTVTSQQQSIKSPGSTKLHMENLLFSVTQEDLEELFGSIPGFSRVIMHYNKAGRSQGSAEIIFTNAVSAAKAMSKYNGMSLDGRPMKITTIGGASGIAAVNSLQKRLSGGFSSTAARIGGSGGGGFRRGRGGAGGGRQVRGAGNKRQDISADALNEELVKYRNETI